MSGAGLELLHARNPSLQYGLLLMTGGTDLRDRVDDNDAVELERFAATGQLALARVRYFPGNNFFLSAGAGLRRIAFEMNVADRQDAARVESSAQATSVVIAASIGNQWTWPNGFFLGADWFGYAVPVANSYSSHVDTEGTATDDLDDLSRIVDDSARQLGEVPSSMVLVLELGWMI
jgi:hypothetical protein